MISTLRIRTHDNKIRSVPLDRDAFSLGRARDNELSYPEEGSLSRNHLRLERDGDDWFVVDLGSRNGTFLNGTRLKGRQAFTPGDRLVAGQLTITGVDPYFKDEATVVFVPSETAGLTSPQTMVTSLDQLLSNETTAPGRDALRTGEMDAARQVRLPVVKALIDAVQGIAGQQPLEELFGLILSRAIETVKAERGVLMTLERGQLVPRATHGDGFRISTTIRNRVIDGRESLLVRDVGQEEALRAHLSISEQQIHSLMAVPLHTQNEVIGLIYVDSRRFDCKFAETDLILLSVFASVAAIRIDRERHIELQRQEQWRTRDLMQAAEIQRGFLPRNPPTIAGLDLAGHNEPCRTVGGDYYDFIPYPDGRLALVLGDVAGKGMAAAMLMGNLEACVQILSEDPTDLATLMSRLNRSMTARCPSNRFITLFMFVLDPKTGAATFCNAGHNPALVVRASGKVETLAAIGTILGFMPDVAYDEHVWQLEPGDMLVLYSDGITEAIDSNEEQFGEQRLTDLVVARRGESAADIVAAVVQAVDEWCPSEVADDDITLIVARRIA